MISKKGEEKLDELREELLKFGRYVQTLYSKSKVAFIERNEHHARDVLYSTSIIDTFQLNIERKVVIVGGTLILTGKNLRFVTMAAKLADEMMHIGKQCLMISKYSMELLKEPPIGFYNSMTKISTLVDEMINNSVKNINSLSIGIAEQMCSKFNKVYSLLESIEKEITETMVQNPDISPQGVKLINLLKIFGIIASASMSLTECSVFIETGEYYRCTGSEFFKIDS